MERERLGIPPPHHVGMDPGEHMVRISHVIFSLYTNSNVHSYSQNQSYLEKPMFKTTKQIQTSAQITCPLVSSINQQTKKKNKT